MAVQEPVPNYVWGHRGVNSSKQGPSRAIVQAARHVGPNEAQGLILSITGNRKRVYDMDDNI